MRRGFLDVDHYCDAGHAPKYQRTSVGGSAAMVQGEYSLELLDCSCKQQPPVAKSSGEAYTKALIDFAQDVSGVGHPQNSSVS